MTFREYTHLGRTFKVVVQHSQYSNGRTALFLRCASPENVGELLAKCTVNLPENDCPKGEVWIKDYNENAGMLNWLIGEGLIERESEAVAIIGFGCVVSRHKLIPQKKMTGALDSCANYSQINHAE